MLLAIGLLIGLILGLTGAGGSVFAVPLLILLAGLPMNHAVGLSLGAVAASTFYGSAHNLVQKNSSPILWKPGIILAIAGAVSAPFGKWLGLQIPEMWLVMGFCLLAAVIALRMWLLANKNPSAAGIVRASDFSQTPTPDLLCTLSPGGQFELRLRCISGLLIGGLIVGVLSGLFGVGGGFLIVPLLLALSAVSMAQAVSTSLMIIALISTTGFISHLLLTDSIQWSLLALVAAGGVIGMIVGQLVSHKIANALLQKIFACGLLLVVIVTVLRFL
jgi:uncharacterized membrane protein YfcA